MKSDLKLFILAMLCVVMAGGAVLAQQNGETWRQKTSVEMQGFSMPAQTTEICVATGQNPDPAAMMRQQNNSDNCQITNQKQSGNKTSYDIKCTGKDAMEAHLELETIGNTMSGTMTAKTKDGPMTSKFEITKLGKACVDKTAAMAKQAKQINQQAMDAMSCSAMLDNAGNDVAGQYRVFFGDDMKSIRKTMAEVIGGPEEDCKKDARFPKFCSSIQTMEGFVALKGAGPEALKGCGLPEADVLDKLSQRALNEKNWDFLMRYGGDKYYSIMVDIAKRKCTGRSFTSNDPEYDTLCWRYGKALVSGDRQGALESAGVTGGSSTQTSDRAVEPGNTGSNDGGATAKPKSAIDAGRQKIRGLLGR